MQSLPPLPYCRERKLQYFWEVFPAQDGVTTYMFSYTDPSPGAHLVRSSVQHDVAHPWEHLVIAAPRPWLVRGSSSLHTGRASLREVYGDYLQLLPQYQEIDSLEDVTCIRPFFGFVPNWIDSPLQPITSRLLHIGDSAGNRSQLSFAGECFHELCTQTACLRLMAALLLQTSTMLPCHAVLDSQAYAHACATSGCSSSLIEFCQRHPPFSW